MRPFIFGILFLLPATSLAQAPAYQMGVQDTVRYRVVSDASIVTKAPQATIKGSLRIDAVVDLLGAEADSATGSFKRLILIQRGPQGVERSDTDSLLGLPFRLHFPSNGKVSVVSAPRIPDDLADVVDVESQFEALFISLPAGALVAGTTWADTLVRNKVEGKNKSEARTIREYAVLRDTLVAETRAVVISVVEKRKVRGTKYVEEQKGTADVDLQGKEEGIAVFAPEIGRLLGRRSQGKLEGSIGFEGSGSRLAFSQTFEFTDTVDLLP